MFYDNFVRMCNKAGKSPSFVASQIGLTRASVSGWKHGKKPTDATVLKLADYFDVTVEMLLADEESTAFYDNFLQLCNQKGISPTAAVVDMGFQKSVVTRWKKSVPTDANKRRIADYFGVSVDYLLGNEQKEEPQPEQIDLSDVELGFLGDYKELTEENKATVRDMVRLMRERQKEG